MFVNYVKKFVRRLELAEGFRAIRGTIGSAGYGRPGLGNDCKVHSRGTEKLAFSGCGVPIFLLRSVGL